MTRSLPRGSPWYTIRKYRDDQWIGPCRKTASFSHRDTESTELTGSVQLAMRRMPALMVAMPKFITSPRRKFMIFR
jgi:hypothetical protein